MYEYDVTFLTRYPEDGSRGNYAWGILSVQGESETDTIDWIDAIDNATVTNYSGTQYTIETHGVTPSIKPRALERVARTLGERDALKRGGALV